MGDAQLRSTDARPIAVSSRTRAARWVGCRYSAARRSRFLCRSCARAIARRRRASNRRTTRRCLRSPIRRPSPSLRSPRRTHVKSSAVLGQQACLARTPGCATSSRGALRPSPGSQENRAPAEPLVTSRSEPPRAKARSRTSTRAGSSSAGPHGSRPPGHTMPGSARSRRARTPPRRRSRETFQPARAPSFRAFGRRPSADRNGCHEGRRSAPATS